MLGRATTAISAILVDDEQLACDELSYLLKKHEDVDIVATANNGLDAVKLVEELEPDIVFLDVQMPGIGGLDVISQLKDRKVPLPYFILVTAYDQYAVEAFRLEAMDYLLKPVDAERLEMTMERARRAVLDKMKGTAVEQPSPSPQPPQRTKLLVKSGSRNLIVDASDMIYATIEDGLITIVTAGMEGQSNYRTIEELQSNLDPDTFWRVHRSYLVNIHKIKEVIPWFKSSYQLKMDDKKQTEVPVSRVQTKRLRALLKL